MATIKNITTNEIVEVSCFVDGEDILSDVMGNSGVDVVALSDSDIDQLVRAGETNAPEWAYALDSDDVAWWERWASREERITEAYAEADEDARIAYEKAIEECGHDFEALQDAQEEVLGIA